MTHDLQLRPVAQVLARRRAIFRFEEELGKYGCPNCEGDSGPARKVVSFTRPEGVHMGGKPSKGTPADKRLKRNQKPAAPGPKMPFAGKKALPFKPKRGT